jgi:ABC-type transporter Mla subunit MlaD
MKIEGQVKQLTDLMADLIPAVDRLAQNQEKNTSAIQQVVEAAGKTNPVVSEMRLSNIRMSEAIEKLILKIDKMDQFENRLTKLENTLFK